MNSDAQKDKDMIRFLSYVNKNENGCWMWIGGTDSKGYGIFWYKGKTCLAHRVSLQLHTQDKHFIFDKEKQLRHLCNHPSCVNPEHLKEGTKQEDHQDKILNGTALIGERCHFAKLSWDKVSEIRKSDLSRKNLAKEYNVSTSCISSIKNNNTWVK